MIHRARFCRRLAAALLGFAAAALWLGCSIQENYETLSFFFDGVPDPNAPPNARRGGRTGAGGQEISLGAVSAHPAYLEGRCQECHGSSAEFGFRVSGFTELNARICLNCHGDVFVEHKRLHGPVAAAACLQCHQPHESAYPALLIADGPAVCMKCHQSSMEFSQKEDPIPEHEDLTANCLDCHSGHGGDLWWFPKSPQESPSEPDASPAPATENDGTADGDEQSSNAVGLNGTVFNEFVSRLSHGNAERPSQHCPPWRPSGFFNATARVQPSGS